ncbi:hypothetical protein HPB52_007144 [Rhipicephalus sanguineus]|uniref:ABC transporter domain-containing protein n=1 Tax=Rhipicephalus sanguineus TaxID=34632 RepID=A0A9D4PEX5_RHISA|nr:hypothetical protein HPB52_007144 [Rhipicephalus sanguineus]
MEDRDTRRPGRPRKAPDEQKKKYARVSPVDRCRIIDVHRRGGDLKVLSETLGINIKTVRSIAATDRDTAKTRGGSSKKFGPDVVDALQQIVQENPSFTLEQIKRALKEEMPNIEVSTSTIDRLLDGHGYSVKLLTQRPVDRNRADVKQLRRRYAQWLQSEGTTLTRYYIDETNFNVALASFAVFIAIDPANILDANKAFVSLSLFNILRVPMAFLPMLITFTAMASVSQSWQNEAHLFLCLHPLKFLRQVTALLKGAVPDFFLLENTVTDNSFTVLIVRSFFVSLGRINKYLRSDELDPNAVQHDTNEVNDTCLTTGNPLVIKDASFAWEKHAQPALDDLNISVPTGALAAVVGSVGSGKSSMLSAFLGDMVKLKGSVNINGSVAYCPQQAWIQNASVKNNITFGQPFDRDRYEQVIEACALKQDLDILPGGDDTEVGEKQQYKQPRRHLTFFKDSITGAM